MSEFRKILSRFRQQLNELYTERKLLVSKVESQEFYDEEIILEVAENVKFLTSRIPTQYFRLQANFIVECDLLDKVSKTDIYPQLRWKK